ncbi:MAG: MATE family efflux transporter, partial [Clostridia bacterium]|nr:MATE family efflux transporter [Clostridia bacterium]
QRLNVLMVSYFLCSMMDISGCQLRGMGKSLEPMIISLIGACGIRTLWLYTGFRLNPQLWNLYLSYPISWALTFAALFISYLVFMKKLRKNQ